jgi:hypothetical protein
MSYICSGNKKCLTSTKDTAMNTQIMTISKQEMIIASYAITRSNDAFLAALQMSKCNELVNRLRNGIVHGFFKKKDGSIREFWGTTNPSLAEKKTIHPIGTMPRLSNGVIPFICCETGQWRSMRIGSFIGYAN